MVKPTIDGGVAAGEVTAEVTDKTSGYDEVKSAFFTVDAPSLGTNLKRTEVVIPVGETPPPVKLAVTDNL